MIVLPPVLADSSVWIDHFRRDRKDLAALIKSKRLVIHEFVFGELILGAIPRAARTQNDLSRLKFIPTASHAEVLQLVGAQRLVGTGIGWVDAHLLAAAALSGAAILTQDASLVRVAAKLGLLFKAE